VSRLAAQNVLAEKILKRETWEPLIRQPVCREPNHVCEILDREGLISPETPIADVGCGPSPHLAWNLLVRVQEADLSYIDFHTWSNAVHRTVYEEMRANRGLLTPVVWERWHCCDIFDKPYLLRHKTVIVHGELPLVPGHPRDDRAAAIRGLLDAQPELLALYLYAEHPYYRESPSRILPILDDLGLSYRRFDNVSSADFRPQAGGTLLLIAP
jgi:hypothetical protein